MKFYNFDIFDKINVEAFFPVDCSRLPRGVYGKNKY